MGAQVIVGMGARVPLVLLAAVMAAIDIARVRIRAAVAIQDRQGRRHALQRHPYEDEQQHEFSKPRLHWRRVYNKGVPLAINADALDASARASGAANRIMSTATERWTYLTR